MKFKKNQKILNDKFTILEEITGGNCQVLKCEDACENVYVLKIIEKKNQILIN